MSKICQNCGNKIFGKARKYCPDCKSEVHKQQMHDYYEANKCKWLCINGKYNKKDSGRLCGDKIPFGDYMYNSTKTELMVIEEEMRSLGLTPNKQQLKMDEKDYSKIRSKKYYEKNKRNKKYKSLYNAKLDEGYINILLIYNIKTNHIGIRTKRQFYKKKE